MARIPIVRTKDDRYGVAAAIVYLLTVLFLLFFIKYTEPDPPKVTVPIPIVMSDAGLVDNFEIDNGGGGAPAETVTPTPTETKDPPKEQPTQEEESPVTVPSSTGESSNNNTPAEPTKEPNPFGGSGSGGQGTSGSGTGFGNDDGPGTGAGDPGKGSGGKRVRLKNMSTNPKTMNPEHAKIAFKLIVDSRGKVIRADLIRSETTTSNQQLIDEVTSLVKEEVLYKEKPGAPNEVFYYTVSVKPS